MIKQKEVKDLELKCAQFRRDVLEILHQKQTGHPGGSLSVCEILTSLVLHQMNVNPKKPDDPDRDRLVLSKGHSVPMLYRILAEKGFFPVKECKTFRDINSRMQGHPCIETPGIDLSSGPLGIGLSAAIGMALAAKLDKKSFRVYAVLGDGELNEGTIWESVLSAPKFGVDNLTAIVDWNKVQLDGTTDQIMPEGDLTEKFRAFGWNVIECDGHSIKELCAAYDAAAKKKKVPTVICAHTVKGKGVSFMEGKSAWHGKAIDDDSFEKAMAELGGRK